MTDRGSHQFPASPAIAGPRAVGGLRAPRGRRAAWILLVAAALAISLGSGTAQAQQQDSLAHDPLAVVNAYADIFMAQQNSDGSYALPTNTQNHLKADIAMALAAGITRRKDLLSSAKGDLDWVIANRLDTDGGINWNGGIPPAGDYFFEVHQNWFLIASELLRRQLPPQQAEEMKVCQMKAWQYLLRYNPAGADFYLDNHARRGVFFAYRDVNHEGQFQTQATFKGSYEIGAALWAMALHRGSIWLTLAAPGGPPDSSLSPTRYLDRMVPQILRPLSEHGFFDTNKRMWIRAVDWDPYFGWTGWQTHDMKYAPHMEEGALLYTLLSGRDDLRGPAREDINAILARVYPDGTIRGVPDGNGTAAYEYGMVLSCLGLSAQNFWGPEPDLGNRCFEAGQRVFMYAARTFPPETSEDRAMLLAGFCRMIDAGRTAHDLVWGGGLNTAGVEMDSVATIRSPISLLAWPNPMQNRIRFQYTVPASTAGSLRVIDAIGRECLMMQLDADSRGSGEITWDGVDDQNRRLPSGRYEAILESGRSHHITGFSILR